MDDDVIITFLVIAGVLMLVKMVTSTITNAVRAYHDNKQNWGKSPKGVPPMFEKMLDRAMEERDVIIDELLERIEVLEKIVTDEHKKSRSSKLSEEIENLGR